jgi:hypothetical protein
MSKLSKLIISSVLVADMTPQSILLPVAIGTKKQTIETQALLDCGASGEFMDSQFAKLHNIPLIKLSKPQIARNTDGTQNEQGVVTVGGCNPSQDLPTLSGTKQSMIQYIGGNTMLMR